MAYAEADPATGTIVVQTTWSEKDVVRQVPGAVYSATEKVWRAPLSWGSCMILRGVFKHTLTLGPGLDAWALSEIADRVEPSNVLRVATTSPSDRDADSGLYPFQQADVAWLDVAGDALLCNDMGTGKTISILHAMRSRHLMYTDEPVLPALVVCPNSVKPNWVNAATGTSTERAWFPECHPYLVRGTATVKAKIMKEAAADPLALIVINIEALRSFSRLAPYGSIHLKKCRECDRKTGEEGLSATRCEVHPKVLNQVPLRTVVLDEAHRIKDPRSLQTRAAWAVMHGPTVTWRIGATGTPIANHPGDLWSVMHGIARQDFPRRTQFIDRYCLSAWNPYGTLDVIGINPEHRDEFFRIVDPRVRRMPKELVLPDLPAKVRSIRYVEMLPRQARAYRKLELDFVTELGDGTLLAAPGALEQQARLMQLASSMVRVDEHGSEDRHDWTVHMEDPSPKLDELLVVMDELGDAPLVACAEHRQLIDLASKRLTDRGIPHGLITGAQNEWERQRHLEAFQEGRTRVLLFTIKAGGTGLTMTRAGTIIFLQRSWSMVDNLQAEDRVHRIGSERFHESVHVVDIVTQDTLEHRVQLPRLYEKFSRMQEILRDRELLEAAGLPTDHLDRELNLLRTVTHVGVS
jgi:SNF2 family DNA or RNA helicase